MALSINLVEYEIKNLTEAMRPAPAIRGQLDIGYTFKNQTLEIYEIRPRWKDKSVIDHHSFAKAKFIKSKNVWKIYWMRASGKWELYEPLSEVRQISVFFKVVAEDKYHVFKG